MARIRIEKFAGQRPRSSSRLLAHEQAREAVNCKLWSGELRPFGGMSMVRELTGDAPLSIHRLGGRFWLDFDKDVDAVRGPIAGDIHERTYFTGLGAPMVTDTSLTAAARLDGRMIGARLMGVPAPNTPPMVRSNRTGSGALETRIYVYTYVNEYGEEGPPSPPSASVDCTVDSSIILAGLESPPASVSGLDPAIARRRIYRTESNLSGQAYYSFVAEIDARLPSFVDNVHTADLGEEMRSTTWYPPPADLVGLIALPNGVMAGFRGNEICFSEPLAPHAWPPEYRLITDHELVALGAYDATIVAVTTAYPYLVTGSTPSGMSMSRLPGRQACVSKRGLVSSEAGVIYPTPDGLYLIGPKAGVLVTRDLFTRDEWQALRPSTMHAAIHDGRLFLFHGTGGSGSGGLILDRAEPESGLTRLDFHSTAAYSDAEEDALYLAVNGSGGPGIMRWEGASTPLNFTWRSKTFVIGRPVNLAAARVLADYPELPSASERLSMEQDRLDAIDANKSLIDAGGDPSGTLAGHAVNQFAVCGDELQRVPEPYAEPPGIDFKLFGDGESRLSGEIKNSAIFRLPAGYTAREWEVSLSADFPVREVKLADSAEEIGDD